MAKNDLNTFKKNNIDILNENYTKYENFINKFGGSKIEGLELENYCIGTGEGTFSYDLEFGLTGLGSIKGGSSFKFGVFKNSKGGYSYVASRFGDENDAINKIKKAIKIIQGLNLNKLNDNELDEISNVFSPMVARKITYLYHIEELLPIYSTDLLKEFLEFRQIGDFNSEDSYKGWIEANKTLLENERNINNEILSKLKKDNIIETDLISRYLFEEKGLDEDVYNKVQKIDIEDERVSINEDFKKMKEDFQNIRNDLKNSQEKFGKDIEAIKSDLTSKSIEYIGILGVVLTVIVMNTSIFAKLEISKPQDLIGTILLINTLPIILYFIVLFLGDRKLEDNKKKIIFFLLFLIIQFGLACLFLFL